MIKTKMIFMLILLLFIYILINNISNQLEFFNIQGVQQNLNNRNSLINNESLLLFSIDKLKKDELVKTIKELQSKVKEDDSNLKRISFFEIIKLLYKKIYNNYIFIIKILSKLTIISILFKLFSKINLIRIIWISVYSFISFIFGLSYSDVYGFNDLIEGIKNYWSNILLYTKELKLYKIITKLLTSSKEIDEISKISETINEEELNKVNSKKEIPYENFSSRQSETIQSSTIENNRQSNRNIREIEVLTNKDLNKLEELNKPFYLNWYFLISITTISLTLTYYYWDNISEITSNLIDRLKNFKPDNDSTDDSPKIGDIELNDLTSNSNIHDKISSMDITNISDYQENISKSTYQILAKINNRIHFLENHSDLTTNQILKMNLDLSNFFRHLKINQINQIEIFNKLTNLKLEDGTNVLKFEDRLNLINNINLTQTTLNKHYNLIPNFFLNLDDLPKLNIDLDRPISPLQESTIQLEGLNVNVEKSWSEGESSKISPSSDDSNNTIRASK